MIRAIHTLVYSDDAEATRAFFRDVLGCPYVEHPESAPGWLIWTVIAVGAATSLITLYALARFWNMAFWRGRDELAGYESVLLSSVQEAPDGGVVTATRTTPWLMVGVTTGMVVLTLLLTVFAGPLFDLATRAAENLRDP